MVKRDLVRGAGEKTGWHPPKNSSQIPSIPARLHLGHPLNEDVLGEQQRCEHPVVLLAALLLPLLTCQTLSSSKFGLEGKVIQSHIPAESRDTFH